MLDFIKCNQLLELAKEYNPMLKDKCIRIIKGNDFYCKAIKIPLQEDKFKVMFEEVHEKDYFYNNIGSFLKEKYNLSEASYMLRELQEVFSFLHEIGHIVGDYKIGYDKESYKKFRRAEYHSQGEIFEQYRNIPAEMFADKFAVEIMNKYTAEIYIIMEEKDSIEEAMEEVNFWNEI